MHDRQREGPGPAARASIAGPRYRAHNFPGTIPPPSPYLSPSAPECGSNPGWRKNKGVCYYYNDTNAVDYHAALKHCLDEKALLASIHDKDEQAYINSMVRL